MCTKLITQLLIQSFVVQIITAEEIKTDNKNQLNTTFLPYTLKTKLIRDKENGNVQNFDISNTDEANKYEILDTKEFKYKENTDSNPELQQQETSNWKRLTTYLSPYTTLQNQQHSGGSYGGHYDLYNTPTNLYNQQHHSFQSSSLIGSSNFLLIHIVFFILHLVGLTHILFGIVALLNRILYFGSPLQPMNDGFGSGYLYKN